MKFSISFKYSNVTFKNKETKETIAYETKASEGNSFAFDNVDEDVVIGIVKGIKDKKASAVFSYDNFRTNFINTLARNKCKELYDKLDKGEWKVEDIAISNITIKDVEFTKPTMNAREAITVESRKMKKLNITKEQFNRSKYFQRKYGKLKYVSESGKLFKTNKGKVLKFVNESHEIAKEESLKEFYDWLKASTEQDSGIHVRYHDNEDGTESMEMTFGDRFDWGDDVEDGNLPKEQSENYQHWLQMFKSKARENGWEFRKDYDDTYDEYVLILISVGSIEKYDESYDEYDDEDVGDGQWHVFDYGHGFPYTEQYMIMAPTGDTWPATRSGAICDYDGEYSYSTRQEMEDDVFALEVDGEEWTPTEIEQPYPRPVQKAIRLVISRLEEEGITVDEP